MQLQPGTHAAQAAQGDTVQLCACFVQGDLLLRGWAMLAENCPRCQVPLMRDPKTQDRLCVNCDCTYPAGQALKVSNAGAFETAGIMRA